MNTFLIAIGSFVGFLVAYHTYGRWLARSVFRLDPQAEVPSKQCEDGIDFVPTRRSIVFGHHFTSIAGTGPIVGPAIAVFWGWLPALLWVVFGSIFIGAVHDFGALVVSMRNQGQTIGEVAGRLISPRTKILFLLALFFALTIVLAIFGLVIASIFKNYPQSVLAVWVSLPLAIVVGVRLRRGAQNLMQMSLIALGVIYGAIYLGVYHWPIVLPVANPIMAWTMILLVYCAIASVLPVWLLLQPRDYINSQQLFVALGLLMAGLLVASLSGKADLIASTPAMIASTDLPAGTPPIFPFLFITIACGAISGFHCLVSSGTSSKQIANELDAQPVGYGSMLLEGALAVVVILACCAGVGMGKLVPRQSPPISVASNTGADTNRNGPGVHAGGISEASSAGRVDDTLEQHQPIVLTGAEAWRATYQVGGNKRWNDFKLGKKIGAFVDGGANFLSALGIPRKLGIGIIAVLVACFAATTLDSATRLQRYVIQEGAATLRIKPLTNMYVATLVAVVLGGVIAAIPASPKAPSGTGGLLLWPLFGATNQLLAGLALMVIAFYLWRRKKRVVFVIIPTIIMIVFPGWALVWQLFNGETGWIGGVTEQGWSWRFQDNILLASIGVITLLLQIWMVVEAILVWPKAKGVLEESASEENPDSGALNRAGGRCC